VRNPAVATAAQKVVPHDVVVPFEDVTRKTRDPWVPSTRVTLAQ